MELEGSDGVCHHITFMDQQIGYDSTSPSALFVQKEDKYSKRHATSLSGKNKPKYTMRIL